MSFDDDTPIRFFQVNHSFREEIIVPVCAITSNIDFIMSKEPRYVQTKDGVKCIVEEMSLQNICELEKKVLSLYRITAWDFLNTWYKVYSSHLSCIEFVTLKLKKYE